MYLNCIDGLVEVVNLDVFNHGTDVHTLHHPTKHCMLVIKPGCWYGRYEELRAVAVWTRIGHRDSERTIMPQTWYKLVLEFAAPDALTTRSVAKWITSLEKSTLLVLSATIVTVICTQTALPVA